MDKISNEYLDSRPQRLCRMCGKCCRLSTTSYSYEELKALAEQGQRGAIDFLDIFEPYPSIEAAREESPEIVDNIINSLKVDDKYDEKKISFFKCRYIMDDNLCGIYLNRKELCDRFPSSPWAVVPPGCGFEGWLFQKREEEKKKIRKLKENILDLEVLRREVNNPEQIKRIDEAIGQTNSIIKSYEKYGSADW